MTSSIDAIPPAHVQVERAFEAMLSQRGFALRTAKNQGVISDFSSFVPAPLSIGDYLKRFSMLELEETTYVIAFIFACRFEKYNQLTITPFNIHRIVLVSMRLAIKHWEERQWTTGVVAKLGGVTRQQLNHLEIVFAKSIRFNVAVSTKHILSYKKIMDHFIRLKKIPLE